MKIATKPLPVLCLLLLSAVSATAQLKVDFDRTDSLTEAGYESFAAAHETVGAADSVQRTETFLYGDATVDVTVEIDDNVAATVPQAIFRGSNHNSTYRGAKLQLVMDWFGMDTRSISGTATTFSIILDALPEGTYNWRSYHHDTEYQAGTFDVYVTDASRSDEEVVSDRQMTPSQPHTETNNFSENPGEGNGPEVLSSTVEFTITSNGTDPIRIDFTLEEASDALLLSFFAINGFEITSTDDTDGDNLPDEWELNMFGDLSATFEGNNDSDELTNGEEYALGMDPTNGDMDDDGLLDHVETHTRTYVSADDTGTNPFIADTDNDGLSDGEEITENPHFSNPLTWDTDGDGSWDPREIAFRTNPSDPNSLFIPSSFSVDFNSVDAAGASANGSVNEPGYQPFNMEHEVVGSPYEVRRTESFASPFGTIGVEVDIDSEDAAAWQAISRATNLGYDGMELEMVRDWTGYDSRTGATMFELIFHGLPAGRYNLVSYHVDINNQTGTFNVYSGGELVLEDQDIAAASDLEVPGEGNPPHYIEIPVESDGENSVVVRYELVVPQDAPVSMLFFAINGFTLEAINPPLDSFLSKDTVLATSSNGAVVGAFSSTDPHPSATHVYELVDGAGAEDNALFSVENGTELVVSGDVASRSGETLSIRVAAFNNNGGTMEKTFSIFVDADDDVDNIGDSWELSFGTLGDFNGDGTTDSDSDGLTDLREFELSFLYEGLDPTGADTDGDTLSDGEEVDTTLTSPVLADTDNDGLDDNVETNDGVFVDASATGTDPNNPDTDGDTSLDGDEVAGDPFSTDPVNSDSDGDQFPDGIEVTLGSDPTDIDSDPGFIPYTLVDSNTPGESWLTGSDWSNGEPPYQLGRYSASAGRLVRSPEEANPAFAGRGLVLNDEDTALELYHTGTATVPGLVLNGGEIVHPTANTALGLDGSIAVESSSFIEFRALGSSLAVDSPISGEGGIHIVGAGDSVVEVNSQGNREFTGSWTVEQATLRGTTDGSLGSGDITLDNGILDVDYNLSSVGATLDVGGVDSRVFLKEGRDLAFSQIAILGDPSYFQNAGTYSYGAADPAFDLAKIEGGVLALVFIDEGGTLTIAKDDDGDKLLDSWELSTAGDLATLSTGGDADGDGLTEEREFANGSNPLSGDSDEDGLGDKEEVDVYGSDPALVDTDSDGFLDGDEVNVHGSSPVSTDSDEDGLTDAEEIADIGSDPGSLDSDSDGFSDLFEVRSGFDATAGSSPGSGLGVLFVDFNRVDIDGSYLTGSAQMPGFSSFDILNSGTEGDYRPLRAEVFNGVSVTISSDSALEAAWRSVGRSAFVGNYDGAFTELAIDWFGIDGRTEGATTLTLTIEDLPEGVYDMRSFHQDFQNQTGLITIRVDGTIVETDYDQHASEFEGENPGATNLPRFADFKIESDGSSPIVIDFTKDAAADAPGTEQFVYLNGFHITPESGVAPNQDSDGDGFTDSEESLAGTDPNDPNSFFRVVSVLRDDALPETAVGFESVSGRSYQIQYKERFNDAEWTTLETMAGDGGVITYADTDITRNSKRTGFYRVVVVGD